MDGNYHDISFRSQELDRGQMLRVNVDFPRKKKEMLKETGHNQVNKTVRPYSNISD